MLKWSHIPRVSSFVAHKLASKARIGGHSYWLDATTDFCSLANLLNA